MHSVLVFGGSGYTGLELLRWLARHPAVQVLGASSDRFAGRPLLETVPSWRSPLHFEREAELFTRAAPGMIALLATPAEVSVELAPRLLERGLSVIDLSGAFRLAEASHYPRWYGFAHPHPTLLAEAAYGLPELQPLRASLESDRPASRLIANPGCYATAAALAVAPLLRRGLVVAGAPLMLDGKSGTTGAGRKAEESLSYSEVADTVRPYRIGKHQHTPEIERALSSVAGRPVTVLFTPHLVPMRRGLLVSAYLPVPPGTTEEAVSEAYRSAYQGCDFIRVLEDRPAEPGRVLHTNLVEVSASLDPRTDCVVAIAALDNLVKGAAGQAIQNLNRMLGLPATEGLEG